MKKIAKTGDTAHVKRAVKRFATKCAKFSAQSFVLTKLSLLEEIGDILQKEEGKKMMYIYSSDDESINLLNEPPVFDFKSDKVIQEKIESNLLQEIGVA